LTRKCAREPARAGFVRQTGGKKMPTFVILIVLVSSIKKWHLFPEDEEKGQKIREILKNGSGFFSFSENC
jgi:hypothetical protein